VFSSDQRYIAVSYLIISSTAPGAGRTTLAAALAKRSSLDGLRTAVGVAFKSADCSVSDADLKCLLPGMVSTQPERIKENVPLSEQIASVGKTLSQLGPSNDVVIVEGLAGNAEADRALAEELDAAILLVTRWDERVLESASQYGNRLAGIVTNNVPQYKIKDVESGLEKLVNAHDAPIWGWLPEARLMLSLPVRTYAEHLQGRFVSGEKLADHLVENVLIGGMVLDWGPHYFGSQANVGVLVRGDRPDIQIAALQTDPPVRALILTNDTDPVEYVSYEAERQEVPIVVVPGDTHESAAKLEAILGKARFDHPDKLEFALQMVEKSLDIEAIDRVLTVAITG